jgi:hypothetical protein
LVFSDPRKCAFSPNREALPKIADALASDMDSKKLATFIPSRTRRGLRPVTSTPSDSP